jgi:urocanate hydratase
VDGFLCTLQELGSDQTSLHNPYSGGYYPAGLSFDEANEMMFKDPAKFKYALSTGAFARITIN